MTLRFLSSLARSTGTIVSIVAGVIFLFVWGSFSIYQHLYDENLNKRREEAERLLSGFTLNSTRLFDYADSYLRAARTYGVQYGIGAKWQHFVKTIESSHGESLSNALSIVDRNGRIIYPSDTPSSDMAHSDGALDITQFRNSAKISGDSLLIGATDLDKTTGSMHFRCALPLYKNGEFHGLVMLTLPSGYLIDFYRDMSLGRRSSLTLMTLEPRLIARQPPPKPDMYGRPIARLKEDYGVDLDGNATGSVLGIKSPFDQESRFDVYFNRLKDYPIVVIVGISDLDLKAEMGSTRLSLTLLALMFSTAVAAVAFLLSRMYKQNSRLKEALETNRAADAQLRIAAVAFDSREGMVITDAAGIIVRVNQAFVESSGYPASELIGQKPRLLRSGRHNAEFYQGIWDSISQTGGWQGEIWDRRKDGGEYPKWLTISAVTDAQGVVTHYVGTHFDISERKRTEERIHQLAFNDQLTGLPNRSLLLDRLQQSIDGCARRGSHSALLFIDLDNFKILNDTLGHDKGDLLLREVAQRLRNCVRESDTVARLGGDEFVIILKDLSPNQLEAAAQVEIAGEKIITTLNREYHLGHHRHHSTPSIGAVVFGRNEETREDLLKQADLAMYQAKAAGRNALRFFDPEMQAQVTARVELENELRNAIRDDQFILHFQPQVDDQDCWTGAEVLVRWLHPQRGLLSPHAFIRLAEENGMILPIGQRVLEIACEQLALWSSRQEFEHLTLAVNISGRQIKHEGFVGHVLAVLERTGADPRKLKLELTESQLLTEVESTIVKMNSLRVHGVTFALDDFGTGYSSLSYLRRLPLEKLKIDRSFVNDVTSNPNDAAITRTIIALAHTLGLKVLAEGVESEEQRDFLTRNGCYWYQGHLFGHPMPLSAFEASILQRWSRFPRK